MIRNEENLSGMVTCTKDVVDDITNWYNSLLDDVEDRITANVLETVIDTIMYYSYEEE